MQKILEIMKRSLLAKLCLQMFIFNFFCMQTFGMVASYMPQGSYGEDKQVYICNKPEVDISFNFVKDDFLLSYTSGGQQESLSKKDSIFDGEKYVFSLGENFCLSVDELEHKIFCHRLLTNSSVSFSVGSGSLLLYEILCGGSMDLRAGNIGVLGLVSASQGSVFNASNSLENLGMIDSPQVMIMSEQTKNFGKVLGKNVTVNSIFIELNENSVTRASENLGLKGEDITADKASIITDQANIEAEKFELTSSVLGVADNLVFQGTVFRLKDQSTVTIGSAAGIKARRFSNYGSRFEAGDLQLSVESFLNMDGKVFSWKDAYIDSEKAIENIGGKVAARKNLDLSGNKLINAEYSLIEGGSVKITADNGINRKSIIRSLLKDVEINLKMNGGEFISNKYALTNAKNTSLKMPEDEFKGKRFAERQSKYPNPNKEESKKDNEDQKEKDKKEDGSENQASDEKKKSEKNNNNEVGSFLNYSGEIISARNLSINGSGGFYNVVDSIIDSQGDAKLRFYGRVLNKSRSEIKSQKDADLFSKMGIIYFENSKLAALNNKLESSDINIDEFSEISGRGKLISTSEKFINKGNLSIEEDIDLKYEQFDNSGKISSKKDIEVKALADFDDSRISFENEGGEINSAGKVTIESINAPIDGKVKAREFVYKLLSPEEGASYPFLLSGGLECENVIYDYGIGDLLVDEDVILKNSTTFISGGFYNEAVIKALSKLKIKSQRIENGYEHNLLSNVKPFNGYNLKESEYEFHNDAKVSVDKNDIIYIRSEKLDCSAAILGEDELEFETGNLLYNSGTIESKKKITLNGKKIQTGWATWEQRALQLPFVEGIQHKYTVHDGVFDFPYDFYKPQKSIIRSYGDIEVNCEKFISSFGNVKVDGKLNANVNSLFLNYAGNVMLGSGSHIKAKEFVNTIGAMATNEAEHRYWEIATSTTDPATLLCNGELKIDVDSYFKNKASYLSAVGDIYLNGKRANDILNGFDSRFVNASMGTEYSRMYTISGVDVSKTTRRVCGISCGSSKTVTYWWEDINGTVKDKVLRGAISSANKIVMQGFDSATNTGVIDAQSIVAKNIGSLGFSHGDKSRLKFSAQQSESKKVTVESAINGSDFLSDYLFENPVTDDVQIPFAIIDDGTISLEELVNAKPAMTIPEYAQVMYRELLKNYSTSRLSDMPTFEAGAQLADKNTEDKGTEINLPHFAQAATKMFTVKPEDVKAGIYFRPYKYTDKYYGQITLFPELYLSDVSLHPVLRDSYGAMHAEEDIKVETEGNFDATASMASGGRTKLKAKNVNFETQTYDRHTVTHQHFEYAKGGSVLGTKGGSLRSSKTTGTKTQWERLITAREPVIISTGKGLGICLQEGGTAEFKGVIGKLGGGYQVKNGNVKLTPLMVNEVSVNENGSYVVPEYLKTVLDVDGNTDLDIDVFENTGSEIRSTGKLKIKAENVIQSVCEQKYKSNEWYKASQTWSLSRNRHEKCYATKFSIPVMTAGEIEIQTKKDINLEGLITTKKDLKLMAGGDIRLASKAFYQEVDYIEELTGPLVDAKVRRIFSSPQIAPCIVRTGGDYIVEALGNYYQTGVHSKILGNKTVHAKNIIDNPLRVKQSDTIYGHDMENITIGLPSYITQPSFVLQFSNEGNRILNQHPLFQAFCILLGTGSSPQKTSALVRAGVEVYGLVKSVSDIMANSNDGLTAQKAGGIVAKLFGFGNFGISGTDIDQKTLNTYGIPSVDAVEGNLAYEADEIGTFTGHQANARNITLKAKKKLNLYADQEEMESSSESWKVTGGFNVSELALHSGHSEAWSESRNVRYHPCSFVARENNIFEAPKIYAENPLWRAQKNQIIGQADFVTKYNYSSGKAQAFNLGLSIGFQGGYPSAWLNFGFSRSNNYEESAPLSGIYGDLEITGSLRNDSVPVYGKVQGDYSYSFRSMKRQGDGFGISGSLNMSSWEEFGKSAKNFAQSALAGFLASEVADQAGLGNSVASGIGTLAAAYVSDTNEGLTSQGHISWVHNDKEREIDLIGFNKEQFNAEMAQIRQTVFDDAVDDGVPPAVAEQIAEDKVKKIEQDLAKFKKKVKEVKESIEKDRKREAKGKYAAEENTRSSADDIAIDWLLNPPSDEASTSGAHMSELFREVIREKSNLTPREEMLAYVPKNAKERELKEKTLLRYDAEDLIEKHPMAKDIFIGMMYVVQAVEYVGAAATGATSGATMGTSIAGPAGTVAGGVAGAAAGVAKKYTVQELVSTTMDAAVEKTSSMMVDGMAVSPIVKEEFRTTVKAFEYAGFGFATIKGSKKSVGTLAESVKSVTKGKFSLQKTFTKAGMKELLTSKANDNFSLINDNGIYMSKGKVVNGESVGVGRVSSSVSGSSRGGVRSKSYNVEKLSINERKITRENWRFLDKTEQQKIRDGFFNDKVTNKEWNKPQHKIGGRRAWQNADQKNIYYTKDGRHNDVEVWQVSGKKAEHLGSMEPVEGTMYKEPNHPPERFE